MNVEKALLLFVLFLIAVEVNLSSVRFMELEARVKILESKVK